MGSPRCLEQNRKQQDDTLFSFGDNSLSAHSLPALEDNRAINHPLREHGRETTPSSNCFCKATSPVSATLGHNLLITNRLKRALQPLNENIRGELKTQANRLKWKSQELCSLHHRVTNKEKGVKTVIAQPLALRATTPASLGASPWSRRCGLRRYCSLCKASLSCVSDSQAAFPCFFKPHSGDDLNW